MNKKSLEKANVIPDFESLFDEPVKGKKASPLKIMLGLLKSNRKDFLISSIIYYIKGVAQWVVPIVTANIINEVTTPDSNTLRTIFINVVVVLFLILQNRITHAWYAKYNSRALRSISAGLRNTVIKKLQHLSITYHKEIESGKLQSKFIRDIEAVEFLNNHLIVSCIPAFLNLIVIVGVTLSKNPLMTVFYFLIVPINVFLIRAVRGKMRDNNRRFRYESESISAKVSDMIEMIPVTRAHGLENEEIAKIEENIKSLKMAGVIADKTQAAFGAWSWITSNVLSVIFLAVTACLAYYGKIEVGDIVLYQSYFSQMNASVSALASIYPELAKGTESISSLSEIMQSDDVEHNEGKIPLRMVHGTIRFNNVSYRYPNTDTDVIKNLTLSVEKGECVAFVGASGSGKSTIMNMIIGFLNPTSGEISIDGKPMDAINLTTYRHFVSVVPQNSILFTGSIRDNILYGVENTSEEKLQKVLDLANIREFLDDLPNGIDTVIGEHGDKLSGGQKQRISIARALIRDPKIIILDEATSALDNISEYQVQKAMNSLIKDRTTFIVAHRLSTIRDADKIVVMENGQCVEMGTYEELMALGGKFYELKTLSDINVGEN